MGKSRIDPEVFCNRYYCLDQKRGVYYAHIDDTNNNSRMGLLPDQLHNGI